MGLGTRLKEMLKKGSKEASRKEGKTFDSLSQSKKNELYRNITGGSTTTEMANKGFSRLQIATARENIRMSKGGKGAEKLKQAAQRGEKRTAEKAKKAEKAARETVVQTGSVGTKSVSKKPSVAVSRPRGGTMADTRKGVMRETKEAGRDAKGTMQYEKAEIKLKDNKPTRAQQLAQGKKPLTKSESARKAATSRKEATERMTKAAAKETLDGDIEAFFKKLPGGKQQQLLRSASMDANPEQRLRTLVSKEMRDAGETAAALAKNYRKGGMGTMKGKK